MNRPLLPHARPRTMQGRDSGYALVVALSLVAILAVVLTTYSLVTVGNTKTSRSSSNASAGFYASEAALNARAEQIRAKFKGFETPSGITPTTCLPNVTSGSGDYACKTDVVGGRNVTSYVTEGDSKNITIPAGELFENLNAEETNFTVSGQAIGVNNTPEAITSLTFHSRLVPLFQFAVFFDKDLEFTNTATLNLSGPVHTNGNLFLDSGTGSGTALTIQGQVTAANNIYRGWKHSNSCGGTVRIADAGTVLQTMACGGGRTQKTGSDLTVYGGQVKDKLGALEVPSVEQLQAQMGAQYWDQADVRIVLKRTGGLTGSFSPFFVSQSGTVFPVTCSALQLAPNFRDNREAQYWSAQSSATDKARATRIMLNVDVQNLLTCLEVNKLALNLAGGLANTSQGGLVIFMTVDDSASTSISGGLLNPVLGNGSNGAIAHTNPPLPNNYAVRLYNGATLRSTNATHPVPKGITFVTDQAAFIQGNFNSTPGTWIPTAVMSDSINVLSQGWSTTAPCLYNNGSTTLGMSMTGTTTATTAMGQNWYSYTNQAMAFTPPNADSKSTYPLWCRNATPTTINAAILSGTSTSGGPTGEGTLDRSPNSGGVHNMMRFHEEWGGNGGHPTGITAYTYKGSLVSLNQPLHAAGDFTLGLNTYYNPPLRQWSFEENFRDAAQLPPLSPRFVYLKQDNFSRSFEQP